MEKELIASIIKSREAAGQLLSILEKTSEEDILSEKAKYFVSVADKYYGLDPEAECIHVPTLKEIVARDLPTKKANVTIAWLDTLDPEVSASNVVSEFRLLRKKKLGERLANALLLGSDQVSSLLEEYEEAEEAFSGDTDEDTSKEELGYGSPVASVVESSFAKDRLIELNPTSLNNRCGGGAMRGHHILIYARPEAGKTMFSVNMIAGFLQQGLRVLYIGNEDPLLTVFVRVVSRLTGWVKDEVIHNPETAERLARDNGYDKLAMVKLAPGTPREIEHYIKKYNPDVLIVDQLRNLNLKSENRTTQLEKAATAIRNIAGRHDLLAVSITQAGDSADRRLVLEMGDVDSSNTGIPGQVDLMIGIGVNEEFEANGQRMLNLPKNKLGGVHEHFAVNVNVPINMVTSIE